MCNLVGVKDTRWSADAIEVAANDKTPVPGVSARILTDPKDIAKFMQKRKKANAAG